MSDPPQTPVARKPRSQGTWIMVGAAAGAIAGALLVRRGPPGPRLPLSAWDWRMAICFALWIALSLYWSAAARNVSTTRSSESSGSRGVHLLLVNAAMVLSFWPYPGWLVPAATHFAFPRLFAPLPLLATLGVVLQLACFALAVRARRELGRNWSGEVTLKQGHELVRTGPYRFLRHPIYTGAIGMYLGPALVSQRLQGLLAVVIIVLAYVRKIRQEEAVLGREFGDAYARYRAESWALVPWLY